jgi:two-component system response regulator PrrA
MHADLDYRWERHPVMIGTGEKRAASPDAPAATTDPGASVDWSTLDRTEAPRILLVDDDEAVLDTFARMLRLKGYEVCTVSNPTDGLKEAERRQPDAIILDFRMPLLDGLGFLRSLRTLEHHRSTPVAIVTGDYFLDDAVTNEVRDLGGMVLFKPLWLEQLVDLARTLLTRRS